MATFPEFVFRLSGGPASSTPAASLGGSISTTLVGSQVIAGTAISGVTFVFASGNPEGAGTITFALIGATLTWQPFGEAAGVPVDVSVNGTYVLRGVSDTTSGYVVVTVVSASLPVANTSSTWTVSTTRNTIFDNVSAAEALTGDAEYRCIYMLNSAASGSILAGRLWIGTDASGPDTLAIGFHPGGVDSVAEAIGSESTAPTGVTFSTPLTEAAGLVIPTIAAGSWLAVWMRRTAPALATPSTYDDVSTLRYSITI